MVLLETGTGSHHDVATSQSLDLHEDMVSQKPNMVEVVIHRHHHDVMHQHSNARVSHHDDASHHRHDDGAHLLQGAGRAHLYADLGHRHLRLTYHMNVIAAQDLQYSRQPRRHLKSEFLWLLYHPYNYYHFKNLEITVSLQRVKLKVWQNNAYAH